jgi:hypothetical protein
MVRKGRKARSAPSKYAWQTERVRRGGFLVHPVAISDGTRVFRGRKPLTLKASTAYTSGIVVNTYAAAP